jgi:MoxR-like ATPase
MDGIQYGPLQIEPVGGAGWRARSALPASVVRRPAGPPGRRTGTLLGRRPQIDAALDAVRLHLPIEILGPCGSGKSSLLQHLAALRAPSVFLDAQGDGTGRTLVAATSEEGG